jgi:hypothetical protein
VILKCKHFSVDDKDSSKNARHGYSEKKHRLFRKNHRMFRKNHRLFRKKTSDVPRKKKEKKEKKFRDLRDLETASIKRWICAGAGAGRRGGGVFRHIISFHSSFLNLTLLLGPSYCLVQGRGGVGCITISLIHPSIILRSMLCLLQGRCNTEIHIQKNFDKRDNL